MADYDEPGNLHCILSTGVYCASDLLLRLEALDQVLLNEFGSGTNGYRRR